MSGMEVISFRIPKELKKSIKEVDINWSEEVRRFIEDKVREFRREKALEEIDSMLKNVPKPERGTASGSITFCPDESPVMKLDLCSML